jgi:hypothetical protein
MREPLVRDAPISSGMQRHEQRLIQGAGKVVGCRKPWIQAG